MRIGIDLDGVVYDSETLIRARSEIFDIEINGNGIVNPNSWLVQDKYNWSHNEKEKFYELVCDTVQSSSLMPYAKEIITKLKNEGNEIYIITARGNTGEYIKEITKDILKKDGISYDKIIFSNKSKLQECIDNKIQLMIDDRPAIVKELSDNKIHCLYFREAESETVENENVITVYNWGQIYRVIREMNK